MKRLLCLLALLGGCDSEGPPPATLPACITPLDDTAESERLLTCYPVCAQMIIASCLPRGTCTPSERYPGGQQYKNCVEVRTIPANNRLSVSRAGGECYQISWQGSIGTFMHASGLGFTIKLGSNGNPSTLTCGGRDYSFDTAGTKCIPPKEIGNNCNMPRS